MVKPRSLPVLAEERIVALEAENERLRELLRKRTQDAHACRHLGAIIGPAHSGSFEDCDNKACQETHAALKEAT